MNLLPVLDSSIIHRKFFKEKDNILFEAKHLQLHRDLQVLPIEIYNQSTQRYVKLIKTWNYVFRKKLT